MNQYVLLIIYWVSYYLSHSLLASDFAKKRLFFIEPYYRIFYNTLSILGLLAVLLFSAMITPEWLFTKTGFSKFFGLMPATYGILILKASFKKYSLKDFLGTAQLKKDYTQESFIQSGILKHVRHPIYLGTLLIVVGFFIFSPSIGNLLIMIITIGYLFVGIYLEENKLIKMYGTSYEEYKKNVPMIIPRSLQLFH